MIGIIYKYTSPSNKVYIGQTVQPTKRKTEHKVRAKWIKEGYFSRAILKYGFENFKYEVLETIEAEDLKACRKLLDPLEKKYIEEYNSNNPEFGYNLTKGGGGTYGWKMPKELREKLSKEYSGKGNPMYGKKLSKETLAKIS